MKRQVSIKNTTSNSKDTHMIEATTFGELQDELGVDYSDNKVIVREGRQTLELKDASLPEGSFHMYVMPKKTKAGADYKFPQETNWEDLGHNDLRAACKERGLPAVHVPSADMRESLEEFVEETSEDKAELLAKLKNAIDILGDVYSSVEQLDADGTIGISIEELEADIESIQAELN